MPTRNTCRGRANRVHSPLTRNNIGLVTTFEARAAIQFRRWNDLMGWSCALHGSPVRKMRRGRLGSVPNLEWNFISFKSTHYTVQRRRTNNENVTVPSQVRGRGGPRAYISACMFGGFTSKLSLRFTTGNWRGPRGTQARWCALGPSQSVLPTVPAPLFLSSETPRERYEIHSAGLVDASRT